MLIVRVYRRFIFYLMYISCWFVVSYPRICYYLCKRNLGGMDKQTFMFEIAKYARLFHAHSKGYSARELQIQLYAFTHHLLNMVSDTLNLSEDPCEPTVLAVVRDEQERIKVFFQHYRKLGVKQFVIIDNGSTDGTLDWVSQQQGTRCYRVAAKFQTERKVGWIEKVLALTGYNRWYVVVDADELLDYVGSEQHDVKNLILHARDNGYKHLNGYMLDMYSDKPLFAEDCGYSEIVTRFRYFDVSKYELQHYHSDIVDTEVMALTGGARARIFKNKELCMSKQAVFYFDLDILYCNPHYFWPYIKWDERPCSYVLRHYKFLKQDLREYEKRVKEKGFWNRSKDYRCYMESYSSHPQISMMCKESKEYTSSVTLSSLPFLETCTNVNEMKQH